MPNVRFECNSSQKSWTKATQKLVRSWTNDGQNHGGPREIEKQFRGVKKVGQNRAGARNANIKMQSAKLGGADG